jgi:hypothetical protein
MTEAEWLRCADPSRMLEHLPAKVSERKLRLFGCAVCRLVWHVFTDERSRRAVEVVERYADGFSSREEMAEAERDAEVARGLAVGPFSDAPRRHRSRAGRCTSWAAYSLTNVPEGDDVYRKLLLHMEDAPAYALDAQRGRCRENRRLGAIVLRDIVGNLFQQPVINRAFLAYNAGNVANLARAAYDERIMPSGELESQRLAVLADALEDAGCADADILGHLRGPGPHVRGCWVLDLLLNRA